MKKTKMTRTLMAACSVVALSAVMYGCSSSSDSTPPPAADVDADKDAEMKALSDAQTAAMTAANDAKTAWQAARAALTGITGMMDYNPVAYARAKNALADAKNASDAAAAASAAAVVADNSADAERHQATAEAGKTDAETANTNAMTYVQEVKDVPAARTAAAAAAADAKTAYDAAQTALAAVEAIKADDMESYDTAREQVAIAKAAYEAAMAASDSAGKATTSADAKAEAAKAETARQNAEAANTDAMKYAGMVTTNHNLLTTARDGAAAAAADAMTARNAAQTAVDDIETKKDDDVANHIRAGDALMAAKGAYDDAAAASAAAAETTDPVEAEKQQGIAETKKGEAEAAKDDAVMYADLVTASFNAAEKVRTDAKSERMALKGAQDAAEKAATEAETAATEARTAADNVAELLGNDDAQAAAAALLAVDAETAATTARTASDNAQDDTTSGDAEEEQKIAEDERDTARMKLADAQALELTATIGKRTADRARISDLRGEAMEAKGEAQRHAADARSKATSAGQQAVIAEDAATKAERARTDSASANAKAEAARDAATLAEAAATAAEEAAEAANAAYEATKAEGITVEAATAERDEARRQNGIAADSNTDAVSQYDLAKAAAEGAAVDAGINVLGLLQAANAEQITDAAMRAARMELVRENINLAATLAGHSAAFVPTTVDITWRYHGDVGTDGPGGSIADTGPGEGTVEIAVDSRPGVTNVVGSLVTLVHDDAATAGIDESNFIKGRDLGGFAEYHIAIVDPLGTGDIYPRNQVLLFTDKEQAAAPIPEETVAFSNKVPSAAARLSAWDVLTLTATYDHDGNPATDGVAVAINCPAAVTCTAVLDGTDVTSLTGWRISSGAPGALGPFPVPEVEEAEDNTYLAFGVWLYEGLGAGNPPTFGAFGAGSSSSLALTLPTITGTATYNGKAAGLHEGAGGIEFFQADAELTADFGDASAAGTITGRIHDIFSGGSRVSESIYLDVDIAAPDAPNIIVEGIFNGRARMGAGVAHSLGGTVTYPYNGFWSGQFYNDAPATAPAGSPPMSAAGTFGVAHTDDMGTPNDDTDDETSSFVGGFGAHRN